MGRHRKTSQVARMEYVPDGVGEGQMTALSRRLVKKRTVPERERDLVLVAKWYIQGKTQQEISDLLNAEREGKYTLSRSQIAYEIAEVMRRWQLSYLGSMEELKGRQLASLDRAEAQLWEAWERSLGGSLETERLVYSGENRGDGKAAKDVKGSKRGKKGEEEDWEENEAIGAARRVQKEAEGGEGGKAGSQSGSKSFYRSKYVEKHKVGYGDINIIEEIRRIVETRAKILGLIVTKSKVDVNWRREAERAGLNPDEMLDDAVANIIDGTLRDA